MGYSSWSNDAYSALRTSNAKKSVDDIFTSNKTKTVTSDMSPKGLVLRESRDSITHPNTIAVIVNLDDTGSMANIPVSIVKDDLPPLLTTCIAHGLPDVQVLFNVIGDHHSDSAPLQVGQFESGTDELMKWLTSAYLERNGGGQNMESYLLAWYVAARHTSIDCFEKRGEKGVLFTIGDEMSHPEVNAAKLQEIMGLPEAEGFTAKEILEEAERTYNVFHIHVNSTQYKNNSTILNYWKEMLPERLIILEDSKNISEVIATTVAMLHGISLASVVSSFDSDTAASVSTALAKVNINVSKSGSADGVMVL